MQQFSDAYHPAYIYTYFVSLLLLGYINNMG